jgi:hypothetical protein
MRLLHSKDELSDPLLFSKPVLVTERTSPKPNPPLRAAVDSRDARVSLLLDSKLEEFAALFGGITVNNLHIKM